MRRGPLDLIRTAAQIARNQIPGADMAGTTPLCAVRVHDRVAIPAGAAAPRGGVSVMTWISLIGITLAVMALIATLAVRSGFAPKFVDTILGANAM